MDLFARSKYELSFSAIYAEMKKILKDYLLTNAFSLYDYFCPALGLVILTKGQSISQA